MGGEAGLSFQIFIPKHINDQSRPFLPSTINNVTCLVFHVQLQKLQWFSVSITDLKQKAYAIAQELAQFSLIRH